MNAKTTNTNERPHSHLGMSRWPALFACAHFESKPTDETSTDAFKGTEVHETLADFLNGYKQGKDLSEIDPNTLDMFEASALRCAMWVAQQTPSDVLLVEERIEITPEIYGYCDVAWFDELNNQLVVLDFKTFRNVSRDYTAQLAGYGYGLALKYNPLTIKLCTWYGDNGKQPEPLVVSIADCREYYQKVIEIVDKKSETKPTCCGWCEYCAKNGTCEAFKAVAVKTTTPTLQKATEAENWALMSAADKVKLLVIAEIATKWAGAVRDLAKTDLENNIPLVDDDSGVKYELRFTRGRLSPKTPEACRMLVEKGVDADDIKKYLSINATGIKALLKDKGLKTKEIDALLEEVSERGNGSYSMVKA